MIDKKDINKMKEEENKKNTIQEIDGKEGNDKNMNFLDHLEELRKRIIYVIIFLVIACIIVANFISSLMQKVFLAPANNVNLTLQNLQPFGQPFLYFKIIFITATIITIPFLLLQFWNFLSPALYKKEKKWVGAITIITSFCFLSGVVFSYFVLIPSMLLFAANFGTELIVNNIDVNEYFSFISMILLVSGIIFELPIISFILSKFNIITPNLISKYRKHSIVVILILAAVLTPTPDPISQLMFAAPIVILYEISILVSRIVYKKNNLDN